MTLKWAFGREFAKNSAWLMAILLYRDGQQTEGVTPK